MPELLPDLRRRNFPRNLILPATSPICKSFSFCCSDDLVFLRYNREVRTFQTVAQSLNKFVRRWNVINNNAALRHHPSFLLNFFNLLFFKYLAKSFRNLTRTRTHARTYTLRRQLKITFLDVLYYSELSDTNISIFFSRQHIFVSKEAKLIRSKPTPAPINQLNLENLPESSEPSTSRQTVDGQRISVTRWDY